ncbi:MAG: beta-ketoacyl-ACP synthase [Proteobacteria bacterium]|nr:beta-ketoacyl-ACP synthase [Pseudomonadota bacterium]
MSAKKQSSFCRIKDVGILCSLGISGDEIWPRLIAGDKTCLEKRDDLWHEHVSLFGSVKRELPPIKEEFLKYNCWNNQIAQAALTMIRDEVDIAIQKFGANRVGVVIGSSTSGFAETEEAFQQYHDHGELSPTFNLEQFEYGGLSTFISQLSGVTGPCYSLSTACSAGAKTLMTAKTLFEIGVCDAVIAGGVDSLCRLTAGGFGALEAISADHTNPMSKNRDGLNLGEGGALFLLTKEAGGIQLLGGGESSDAHHISAPHPEGTGAEKAMRSALEDAGLEHSDISYLNLHGTGTPFNDAMESKAVERVFDQSLCCSSTKPLTGHTLGASGAIEAAFLWLILRKSQEDRFSLPPHSFDGQRDPEIGNIELVKKGQEVPKNTGSALMSNSFGFGGNNCTLIIGEVL